MNSGNYGATTTVRVRVPAEHRQLTLLGALTETALLFADFPLDEVADVQIAIDEIAADLADTAVHGSTLECDLAVDDSRIAVCMSAFASTREIIDTRGFSWQVIRAVTDAPSMGIGAYDRGAGGYPVAVEFTRSGGIPSGDAGADTPAGSNGRADS